MQDPNQLIRASALRVLSSIRVSMIVPIMMLAIKESVTDMSPYVRKTAAHAIPKLYRFVLVLAIWLQCIYIYIQYIYIIQCIYMHVTPDMFPHICLCP